MLKSCEGFHPLFSILQRHLPDEGEWLKSPSRPSHSQRPPVEKLIWMRRSCLIVRKSGGEKFHSSLIGNLLRYGMVKRYSDEKERNKGLVHPDIIEISSDEEDADVYVKIAVEK
jgi:hypothetical protein